MVGRAGLGGGTKKSTFLSREFFVHCGCIVVVVSILTAVERCWCSEPAGTSLIPNTRTGQAGP